MLTFSDLLDHALAYAGDNADANSTTKHRRAVQAAYATMATRNNWLYLWTQGRISTNAAYETGTVEYDHTGGANERQLTLAGGTWPSWAAYGFVVIAGTPYAVATRVSDTIVTLAAASNPGEDVAAGTDFSLYRDSYPLPTDFVSGDETVINDQGQVLEYVHPRVWSSARRQNLGSGTPSQFSYVGDPSRLGSLRMVLTPPADSVQHIDFLYRRRPRVMFYEAHDTGLVTVADDTVTGVGTAFKSRMVGSIIRFGEDNQVVPTGLSGGAPCQAERTITAVASATSLTIDSALDEDITESVCYVVSDPCDIDELGMTEYMLREVECQYRIIARSKIDKLDEKRDYDLAFTRALENDNRSSSRAASLRRQSRRSGLLYHPIDLGT